MQSIRTDGLTSQPIRIPRCRSTISLKAKLRSDPEKVVEPILGKREAQECVDPGNTCKDCLTVRAERLCAFADLAGGTLYGIEL